MSSAGRGNNSSCEVSGWPAGSAADEQLADWRSKLTEGDRVVKLQTLSEICRATNVRGLSELVTSLAGSRDDCIRAAAAQTLESALQPSPAEVPALLTLLSEGSDGEISYWAATLLGRLGKKAVDAVPALCDCLNSSSFLPARERAAWALQEIGYGASDSIPVLLAVVDAAPARLQQLCREAIREIGSGVCLLQRKVA